ncbi:MAG: hypothetical protein IJF33_05040 [Clostridia bacterium]|nr:hypothetical protein [Clostridia bacterium]
MKRRSTTAAVGQGMRALLLLLALLLAFAGCNTTEPPIETSPSEESSTGEETTMFEETTTLEETTDTEEETTSEENSEEESTTEEETTAPEYLTPGAPPLVTDGWIIEEYGYLSPESVLKIKNDYLTFFGITNPNPNFEYLKWLGEFRGVHIVKTYFHGYTSGWGREEHVADLTFYLDIYALYVYQDGVFYKLAEAYEKNLLTYEEILLIQERGGFAR